MYMTSERHLVGAVYLNICLIIVAYCVLKDTPSYKWNEFKKSNKFIVIKVQNARRRNLEQADSHMC